MAYSKDHFSWPNAQDRTKEINQYLAKWYYEIQPHRVGRPRVNKYNLVGDRVEICKTIVVHRFMMGDVEDPDLYAAEPLMQWEHSDIGQWVIKNAEEVPEWFRLADPTTFGYKYEIRAKLMGPALTEWILKYEHTLLS